ncbi:hypothetical protein, partial [Dickeya dadantii]|uniref:hypothetical protein n=1 Tax=Dickeya dadantii TaxID=204038 RepID=UPI001C12DD29
SVVFNASKPVNRCLCGSELREYYRMRKSHFLSCLHGSELDTVIFVRVMVFLSCLYGSEPLTEGMPDTFGF